MTRGRGPAVVAALAAVLAGLTGCGDDTKPYCDELRTQQQRLVDLAGEAGRPGADIYDDSLEIFGTLREAAPDDVRDEWDTLYFAWEGLVEGFDRAGTTPQEFDPENPPPGVSDAEVQALEDAAAELRSRRVVDAGDGIEQHAKDVCGVDLGL
jgi:hypothetical protein